jgi:four helix bundle protein
MKKSIYGYSNLIVWKKAYQLSKKIYEVTQYYPNYEIYGLTSQMRRSATSIIANIAEGYGNRSVKSYINYITLAIGSANELGVYLFLSKDLTYLKEKDFIFLRSTHEEIMKMLLSLRKSLERNNS